MTTTLWPPAIPVVFQISFPVSIDGRGGGVEGGRVRCRKSVIGFIVFPNRFSDRAVFCSSPWFRRTSNVHAHTFSSMVTFHGTGSHVAVVSAGACVWEFGVKLFMFVHFRSSCYGIVRTRCGERGCAYMVYHPYTRGNAGFSHAARKHGTRSTTITAHFRESRRQSAYLPAYLHARRIRTTRS